MTNFEAVLPRNDKIRYFLSQKCRLRAVSRQHAQFALQAEPAVYPALICVCVYLKLQFREVENQNRIIIFAKHGIYHFAKLAKSFILQI